MALSGLQAERSYYEWLFTLADADKDGSIGPADAGFLKKAKLDLPTLSKIWNLANVHKQPALDKESFFVALRLVALAQSGKELSMEALAQPRSAPLIPRFEGVSIPRDLSGANALASHAPTEPQHKENPWSISKEEKKKYLEFFARADTEGSGYISSVQAKKLFTRSRLPLPDLSKVWLLSDIDRDQKLSKAEFVIAMFLINARLRGADLPDTLPASLNPSTLLLDVESPGPSPPIIAGSGASPLSTATGSLLLMGPTPPSAPATADSWVITPEERQKYTETFFKADADHDGYVTAQQAVPLFMRSGLSQSELNTVWRLSDQDHDQRLNMGEFITAMFLISSRLRGRTLPDTLPDSLRAAPPAASPPPASLPPLLAPAPVVTAVPPPVSSAAYFPPSNADEFGSGGVPATTTQPTPSAVLPPPRPLGSAVSPPSSGGFGGPTLLSMPLAPSGGSALPPLASPRLMTAPNPAKTDLMRQISLEEAVSAMNELKLDDIRDQAKKEREALDPDMKRLEALRQQNAAKKEEIARAQQELEAVRQQAALLKDEQARLERQAEELAATLQAVQQQREQLAHENEEQQRHNEQLSKQHTQLAEQLAAAQHEVERLQQLLEGQSAKEGSLKEHVAALRQQLAACAADKDRIERQLQQRAAEYSEEETALAALQRQLVAASTELEHLEAELRAKSQEVDALREKRRQLEAAALLATLEQKARDTKAAIAARAQEAAALAALPPPTPAPNDDDPFAGDAGEDAFGFGDAASFSVNTTLDTFGPPAPAAASLFPQSDSFGTASSSTTHSSAAAVDDFGQGAAFGTDNDATDPFADGGDSAFSSKDTFGELDNPFGGGGIGTDSFGAAPAPPLSAGSGPSSSSLDLFGSAPFFTSSFDFSKAKKDIEETGVTTTPTSAPTAAPSIAPTVDPNQLFGSSEFG